MWQDDDVMGLSGHMRAKCFLFNVLLKISKKDIIIKKENQGSNPKQCLPEEAP